MAGSHHMARPHIEFVNQERLAWQSEPDGNAPTRYKTLSANEETGAFTRLAELPADATMEVQSPTTQELFVLEGGLTVDRYDLGEHEYLRLPGGNAYDLVPNSDGCRFLWTDDGSGIDDGSGFWAAEEQSPHHVDPSTMEWELADLPGSESGLYLKRLYEDPETGAATTLAKAGTEWDDPRQKHHDCAEEIYILGGGIRLGKRGVLRTGDYLWRPPYVRHGGPERVEEPPFLGFVRCDGPQPYHYMTADGVPLNY